MPAEIAYATWDFGGRAGARDLGGLVLIDGASGGRAISRAEARRELRDLADGSPFLSVAGARLPWIAGALASVSSTLALRARRRIAPAGVGAAAGDEQATRARD